MINGRRILITGAGGFIGAYFLEKLKDDNEATVILRRKPEEYWRLSLFEKNYRVYIADLSERRKIFEIFSEVKPEIVIHLASYGAYPRIQKDNDALINTNIIGGVNIADASIQFADITVMVGSSSEYGNVPCPMKEDGPTFPTILYGASKLFTTHYAGIRAKEENKKVVSIRPFSVYGPYEEPFRLIPTICSAAVLRKKLNLSSPTYVRDFVYVGDFLNASLHVIKNSELMELGGIVNVGSGKETNIKKLVELIEKKIMRRKLDVEWEKSGKTQQEIRHWYADIAKIKRIGFAPRYDLERGLKTTIEWITENIEYYKGEKGNEP